MARSPVARRGGGGIAGLSRPRGRMIAGVCAGIARRFGVSTFVVRAAFVISCVLPGPQILIYAALWILIPSDD